MGQWIIGSCRESQKIKKGKERSKSIRPLELVVRPMHGKSIIFGLKFTLRNLNSDFFVTTHFDD